MRYIKLFENYNSNLIAEIVKGNVSIQTSWDNPFIYIGGNRYTILGTNVYDDINRKTFFYVLSEIQKLNNSNYKFNFDICMSKNNQDNDSDEITYHYFRIYGSMKSKLDIPKYAYSIYMLDDDYFLIVSYIGELESILVDGLENLIELMRIKVKT